MEIDNTAFDAMNHFMQDDIQTSSEEEPSKQSRFRDDGTYDIKPLDPDYFKKYYQNKFKLPFTCLDCGTTIFKKKRKFIKTQEHQKVQKLLTLLLKPWTQTSLQVSPALNPQKKT